MLLLLLLLLLVVVLLFKKVGMKVGESDLHVSVTIPTNGKKEQKGKTEDDRN